MKINRAMGGHHHQTDARAQAQNRKYFPALTALQKTQNYCGLGTDGPAGKAGAAGLAGIDVVGAAESRIDVWSRPCSARIFSTMQVTKNRKARIAVVRVRVSAAPRAVNKPPMPPPPPPMPSAPPSERCNRTKPISATAMINSATSNK